MTTHLRPIASLCAALLLTQGCATPPEPPPRLVIDNPLHDFGAVDNRVNVEHRFTLANQGDGPLRFKIVDHHPPKATCACQKWTIHDAILPPGAEGKFAAKLYPRGLTGVVEKEYILTSNDPELPELPLLLRADARKLATYPETVDLGRLATDSEETVRIAFETDLEPRFKASDVNCSVPFIRPKIVSDPKGKTVGVWLKTRPPMPEGPIEGVLEVRGNDRVEPVWKIAVTGEVRKPLKIDPDRIVLSKAAGDQPQRFFVECRGLRPFRAPKLEVSTPGAGVRFAGVGFKFYRYEITNLVASAVREDDRVTVRTDIDGMRESVLPICVGCGCGEKE